MQERKKEKIKTYERAGIDAYERERARDFVERYGQFDSYQNILDSYSFEIPLQILWFEFIKWNHVNGKILTNMQLVNMIDYIKGEAEKRIKKEIYNKKSDEKEDIERYITASINQALREKWFNLVEPKNFLTGPEQEREAENDIKRGII